MQLNSVKLANLAVMVSLVFPAYPFKIREEEGGPVIFDPLRRRWVKLSPEEWVRQNMMQYLLQTMCYPSALVGVEKEIKLGSLRKRFDLLVYNRDHQPWMVLECKAMEVPLTQSVLDQVLLYRLSLSCRYMVITNGETCYAYETHGDQLISLTSLPSFPA